MMKRLFLFLFLFLMLAACPAFAQVSPQTNSQFMATPSSGTGYLGLRAITPLDFSNGTGASGTTCLSGLLTWIACSGGATAAGSLTGATLASNVVNSSLTNVGNPLSIGLSIIPYYATPVLTTASTVNGSTSITIPGVVASEIFNGMNVSGSCIPSGNTVVSGGNSTSIILQVAATCTNASGSATFGIQRYNTSSSMLANTVGADSALIGQAALGAGNWTGIWDGPGRYPSIGNLQVVSDNGTRAAAFYARSADNNTSGFPTPETVSILTIFDTVPSGGTAKGGWGLYQESDLLPATFPSVTAGIFQQVENAQGNQWTAVNNDPYNTNTANTVGPTGSVGNYTMECGAGNPLITYTNCSRGLQFGNNGAQFITGILFANNAIAQGIKGVNNTAEAIAFGNAQAINWYTAAGSVVAQIYEESTGSPATAWATHIATTASNGTISLDYGASPYYGFNKGIFYPAFNNASTLGAASLQWQQVYAYQYVSQGGAGLTCSGTPTSSFATIGGIVTHC